MYFSPAHKRSRATSALKESLELKKKGLIAIIVAIAIGPLAITFVKSTVSEKPQWTLTLLEFGQAWAGNLPLSFNLPDTLEAQVWQSQNTWVSLTQSQKIAPDDKLVFYPHDTFDKSIWHVESRPEDGMAVYRNILSRGRVLVAQWYQVVSQTTRSYRNAKLLQIPAMLSGESRFALITVQSDCKLRDCASNIASVNATNHSILQTLSPADTLSCSLTAMICTTDMRRRYFLHVAC